jgi:hypothetical protein
VLTSWVGEEATRPASCSRAALPKHAGRAVRLCHLVSYQRNQDMLLDAAPNGGFAARGTARLIVARGCQIGGICEPDAGLLSAGIRPRIPGSPAWPPPTRWAIRH